ncbi:MAG: hypothetical protein DHS20C17_05670 [Cyclobacteriaceae bacterium]|nr:MAG: hypothetical protein DHS20C17_05670 [Cyclobacteriaceae bacterium]
MSHNCHVLIIEDNKDLLTMLNLMLERNAYTVSIKRDITDLESTISALSPDVILMDMLLADADGSAICKNLKQDKRYSKIPIVMTSALPSARARCLQAGADQFIGKPFDMEDLLEILSKAIKSS